MTAALPSPCYESSLTGFHRAKIAELRDALGEKLLSRTPIYNDTFSLLRWLVGWNYRVEEIVPRFAKASHLLHCMGLADECIEDLDELNRHLSKVTLASPYFPGGIMSYDDEGNVVTLQCLGTCRPKSLAYCGRISDVYRLTITETAHIYQLVRRQEAKRGKKLGLRVVVDLDGFTTEHLFTSTLKTYANVLRLLQSLFPDLARQVYVINAPLMVSVAWSVIKSVLSEQSKEKVVFLGADYAGYLGRELGEANLLAGWGGKLTPQVGHERLGTLRMGGVPPQTLRYTPSLNPLHADSMELTKLFVPARQRREVEVRVEEDNSTIGWFFYTNGDVEFGVLRRRSGGTETLVAVWPSFILNSDFVPEYGRVKGLERGDYVFRFDNTQANWFGREVKYRVCVLSGGNR